MRVSNDPLAVYLLRWMQPKHFTPLRNRRTSVRHCLNALHSSVESIICTYHWMPFSAELRASPIKLFYRKLHFGPILRHLCARFTAGRRRTGFLMRAATVTHFVSYDGVKLWAWIVSPPGDVKRDETWDRCIKAS